MDLTGKGVDLIGLSKINVLLGKNGSGKSSLLKRVEQGYTGNGVKEINYITPERGGFLNYDTGVENSRQNNPGSIRSQKRNNQWSQFKNNSVSQYRLLEIVTLREIEANHHLRQNLAYSFDSIIGKINSLLTNIKITRSQRGDFEIFTKAGTKIDTGSISSGESELISLAIECLVFEKTCDPAEPNLLLLDEPDVHLHPDLQANFISFLIDLVSSNRFSVVIATHSTAILGALLDFPDARVAILANGSTSATFKPINEMYRSILPIFGAHPLSNLFNQSPIFLVEGEDEIRIFQQAIRTSQGRLKLYPCSVDGVGNMPAYEASVIEMVNGVYDNAKAFSLRDRDGGTEQINDTPPLVRFKLSCRAIENLILADEVLSTLGIDWPLLQIEIERWLQAFPTHPKFPVMSAFQAGGYARKEFDLKEIRNILIGLTSYTKPWEIAVGQTIGKLINNAIPKDFAVNKLCNYLGQKLTDQIKP